MGAQLIVIANRRSHVGVWAAERQVPFAVITPVTLPRHLRGQPYGTPHVKLPDWADKRSWEDLRDMTDDLRTMGSTDLTDAIEWILAWSQQPAHFHAND